ncbi:MAG: glycosyl transferase family protein [Acetobacteraceae bacterium]|nr:glycosyl transferase family protein [Acetobacteraceae bacterium]
MPRDAELDQPDLEHPFAQYVRTLGRGPGRSRALTREEARSALGMVLRGEADPLQVGALLVLLRYRGEDPDEIAGLVEAARTHAGLPVSLSADLDWPSYGAGRTRGAPWYLLAALALARAGFRVLMHGSNAHTSGVPVGEALRLLGMRPAADWADAAGMLEQGGFAYIPLTAFNPDLGRLLHLRSLLGLRSPINTVARLLNPADAPSSVDGVFHPPYIDLHLEAAARLGRRRLLVVKGGGGEAERNPARPMSAHVLAGSDRSELNFGPLVSGRVGPADVVETWERAETAQTPTVTATIGLALLALGAARDPGEADIRADEIWAGR